MILDGELIPMGITDMPINSGAVSGLSYNRLYYCYYDDIQMIGQTNGPVSFQVTTTKENALNAAGRFFIGSILTPSAGAPDTIGFGDGGSGAQYGMVTKLPMSITQSVSGGIVGNGTITNPQNALDGDATTFANYNVTANGATNAASNALAGPAGVLRSYSQVVIKVNMSIPTASINNPGSASALIEASLQGPLGSFSTVVFRSGGGFGNVVPVSQQVFQSDPLPANINLANIVMLIQVSTTASNTSGAIQMNIYEAWIEASE